METVQEILNSVFDIVLNFSKIFSFNKDAERMRTMEFYILMFIGLKGPTKMTDLAKVYSMTKSNITLIIDEMERKNLVHRKRSSSDRRIIHIHLSRKGKAVFNSFVESFKKAMDKFIQEVPREDLQVISLGFEKIVSAMKQIAWNETS